MKTRETTPGRTYSVHTSSGCTVSDKNGWSKAIDAPDGYFTAHAGEVTIDGDDAADVREVFKLAPQQRLALLGVLGGNDGLPAEFKRVEYLESDGRQYMDTQREVTFTTRLEYECQLLRKGSQFGAPLSCTWRQVDNNNTVQYSYSRIVASEYTDKRIYVGFGGKSGNTPYIFPTETRHKIAIENAKIYFNSELAYDLGVVPSTDFNKAITLYLFAAHTINSTQENYASTFYPGRIYSATIYYGDVKKNDFVPCVNTLTGEPCMYDLVTRRALYNLGSGDFTYPAETATYSRRRVLPDWGKLTEHGLRRLYHAPANYQGELYDYALENGYKPIIEPEKPETGYWSPRWTETEEEIVLEWVETEPPMDEHLIQPTE